MLIVCITTYPPCHNERADSEREPNAGRASPILHLPRELTQARVARPGDVLRDPALERVAAQVVVAPPVALLDQPERRIKERREVAGPRAARALPPDTWQPARPARSGARGRGSGRSSRMSAVPPERPARRGRPASGRGRSRASARRSSGTCSSRLALTTASTARVLDRQRAHVGLQQPRRRAPRRGPSAAQRRSCRRRSGPRRDARRADPRAGTRSSTRVGDGVGGVERPDAVDYRPPGPPVEEMGARRLRVDRLELLGPVDRGSVST